MNTDKSSYHAHRVKNIPTTNTGVHSHSLTAVDEAIAKLEAQMGDVVLRITKLEAPPVTPPAPPPVEPPPATGVKFISPTGSDTTGDGSIGSPWKTYTKFYATAIPGNICYARGGLYTNAPYCPVTSRSGTASAPIILCNYPGETPIFVGTGIRVGAAISLSVASSYHVIDGLQFQNFNTYDNAIVWVGQGVGVSSHNIVRKCKFTLFNGSDPSVLTSHGLYISRGSDYTTVEDCTFVGRTASEGGSGVQVYHSETTPPTNWLVQRCIFDGFGDRGAIKVDEPAATGQILHNSFIGNTGRSIDARRHSTLVVRDNACDDSEATALYDPAPYNEDTTADHNFWDQEFDANYLAAGSSGINAASDGKDAGALDT